MLEDNFVSRKELGLVYDAIRFYNQKALEGADRDLARIVTYKMAKTLAMRVKYPESGEKAFELVRDIASWLVSHAVSLKTDERVSLISYYVYRLTFNLGGNVYRLAASDKRFESCFGTDEAQAAFVSAVDRQCQLGKGMG